MPPEQDSRVLENGASSADPNTSKDDTLTKPLYDPSKVGFFSRRRLLGPFKNTHGDLILLAYTFCTGCVDSASFSNWAVFCGMQTGNTVILGLSTASIPSNPNAWFTTLTAITSYLVGAFLTFQGVRFFAPKGSTSNRLVMGFVMLIQALFILIAAALATPDGLVPHNPPGVLTEAIAANTVHNPKIASLLPLLGSQAGMQIATSRLLGYNELPVNVLTSTYCDIMGDANMLKIHNVKRNRRVAAVVLVLGGAIASGWIMRTSGSLMAVLYMAGAIKLAVAIIGFLYLHYDPEQEE